MIAGADLAAWLADPARQRRSLEATDAYTKCLATHPLLVDLRREVQQLEAKRADNLLGVARRFMERRADIDDLIGTAIAAAARDPFFRPPLSQSTSDVSAGLAIFDHPDLWIALGVTRVTDIAAWKIGRSGPASITFPGYSSMFKFVKAGGATLSFWEAPEARDDFHVERSGRCRYVGRRTIEDGELLVMDGRRESFVFEHATSDIVHIQAQARVEAAPLSVEYDSDTLDFVGASSTDEESSRTQMMITLLRIMDRADAAPLIEHALESPHFYTRWHVMREYLALDAEAALPSLRRMAAEDPHPDVRAAARQTLDAFFAEEPVPCRA